LCAILRAEAIQVKRRRTNYQAVEKGFKRGLFVCIIYLRQISHNKICFTARWSALDEEVGIEMALDIIEKWINGLGAISGLVTFAIVMWQGVWRGLQRPAGRMTGKADKVLRAPLQLIIGFMWLGICFILWRPIPITISTPARIAGLYLGALLYFSGLILYLWGVKTLGGIFKPSSGFGVKLNDGHKLITHGPFAIVRHPMYLGLQLVSLGGLLVYRTWTLVFVALNFLSLFIRARREEQALAVEFGEQWAAYCREVPAWIPRIPH
jgi:protein-S-isoprenylcysteine O-methyltransferase Ste14